MWNPCQFESKVQEALKRQQSEPINSETSPSDELLFPPSFQAWKRRQLDISVESEVCRLRGSKHPCLTHVTHTGQGMFTKLKLKDGHLMQEKMWIHRTLEWFTSDSPDLISHRPPSQLMSYRPPHLDRPLSQLMSYRPPHPQQGGSHSTTSRSYSTQIRDSTSQSICTIHRRMELKRIAAISQPSEDIIEQPKPAKTSMFIVACPTDSTEVMACCPLFLP